MIKRILLCTIIIVMSLEIGAQIISRDTLAGSNMEQYAYKYIVELYDSGDNATLPREIYQFQALYPNSLFLPYIKYIQANLLLEAGNHSDAQRLYAELLDSKIDQSVLADVLLNFAISLGVTGNYNEALHLLQRIDSEITDKVYHLEAAKQRASIFYQQGLFFSSEKEYRKALSNSAEDQELQFGLFRCLIKLQKDDEALEILWNQDPESIIYPKYVVQWLDYLVGDEQYTQFDEFILNSALGSSAGSAAMLDLRVRRALAVGDYTQADSLLAEYQGTETRFAYYRSLVLISQGQIEQADMLLEDLSNDPDAEIAVSAYLERLKLLYNTEPLAAISQLSAYINSDATDIKKAESYYTLGYFSYHMDDYVEAIKQLSLAKHYDISRELGSRIDILIAESWYALGRTDMAEEAFNKYLNHYPQGRYGDRAYFYQGYIRYLSKDYVSARKLLSTLMSNYSGSVYLSDASFYLAEMDFFMADYNLALANYLKTYHLKADNAVVILRIAQSYYYLGDYDNAEHYTTLLIPSYDSTLLKGIIRLARKDYAEAFNQFSLAESFAVEPIRKSEALSYKALSLYHMKRFKEASALYLQLSSTKESPDTYLYLSAKSAFAAKDYHQALQLFDDFIDQYPESGYFLPALSSIANSYYNMGNYPQAVNDWVNILIRFRNHTEFSNSDMAIIKDSLLGLELAFNRDRDEGRISDLVALSDTFASEYIRFELNLMLLKLYASGGDWDDVISSAESIRKLYPDVVTEDINLLMVKGLIQLKQFSEADSLLASLNEEQPSANILNQWAELEVATENFTSAMEKYRRSFELNPSKETWLKLLECSAKLGYEGFEAIWALGIQFPQAQEDAVRYRLQYLYTIADYESTNVLAEQVINGSINPADHAHAFLVMGLVLYQQQDYMSCIASLKRVIMLFPEYKDVRLKAVEYSIRAQIYNGALTEAEMQIAKYSNELDQGVVVELSELLEGRL